jgi:hypothetical protein
MTPRPRKITAEQLERIRENAERSWDQAMERLGPDESRMQAIRHFQRESDRQHRDRRRAARSPR